MTRRARHPFGNLPLARFIEATKAAGTDQKDFERVFKKIVKPKNPKKKASWRLAFTISFLWLAPRPLRHCHSKFPAASLKLCWKWSGPNYLPNSP